MISLPSRLSPPATPLQIHTNTVSTLSTKFKDHHYNHHQTQALTTHPHPNSLNPHSKPWQNLTTLSGPRYFPPTLPLCYGHCQFVFHDHDSPISPNTNTCNEEEQFLSHNLCKICDTHSLIANTCPRVLPENLQTPQTYKPHLKCSFGVILHTNNT